MQSTPDVAPLPRPLVNDMLQFITTFNDLDDPSKESALNHYVATHSLSTEQTALLCVLIERLRRLGGI